MKRIIVLVCASILCLALFACRAKGADRTGMYAPKSSWSVTEDITISLTQSSYPVGTTEFTAVLENIGGSVMLYGEGWIFERYENGEWRKLETIENSAFAAIGYHLLPGETKELVISTCFLTHPLEVGRYRITGVTLRTAESVDALFYGGDYTEHSAYQLEFDISQDISEPYTNIENSR